MSLEEELADLAERRERRTETILALLVPIVGAVDTDGEPVFTAARAVARAFAVADALERRLDKERSAQLDELIAERDIDKGDAEAPQHRAPAAFTYDASGRRIE